jgi:hypothetical protein
MCDGGYYLRTLIFELGVIKGKITLLIFVVGLNYKLLFAVLKLIQKFLWLPWFTNCFLKSNFV